MDLEIKVRECDLLDFLERENTNNVSVFEQLPEDESVPITINVKRNRSGEVTFVLMWDVEEEES